MPTNPKLVKIRLIVKKFSQKRDKTHSNSQKRHSQGRNSKEWNEAKDRNNLGNIIRQQEDSP